MDKTKIAAELLKMAKELVGYENEYLISDSDFMSTAVKAIKNIGGSVDSKGGAHSSVMGTVPFIEAGDKWEKPMSIMFLYKHGYPSSGEETPNATFGVYTQMNNKRNNIYKEFSTYGGDSEEKAFKRFERFCKSSMPRHFAKMVSRGYAVAE